MNNFLTTMIHTKLLSVCYRIGNRIAQGIELQLFLLFLSFPILIAWGLPISLMACIGNIVFAPFLSIFLLLCCAIFFLELCNVPNDFVISCLSYFAEWWQFFMTYATRGWLIGFAKPPLFVLISIAALGFLILHLKPLSRLYRIICLLVALMFIIMVLKLFPIYSLRVTKIPCGKGDIIALQHNKQLVVINPAITLRGTIKNWIEYTLLRELTQYFGSTTIDHLIITKPSILAFEYCAQLCKLAQVKRIYLVLWQGQSDPVLLRKYGLLRYHLEKNGGLLQRIGARSVVISLGDSRLVIKPNEQLLTYKDSYFPALDIQMYQDKKLIDNFSMVA